MKHSIVTVMLMKWVPRKSDKFPAPEPAVLEEFWIINIVRDGELPVGTHPAVKELVSDRCSILDAKGKDRVKTEYFSDDYNFTVETLYRRVVEAPTMVTVAPIPK